MLHSSCVRRCLVLATVGAVAVLCFMASQSVAQPGPSSAFVDALQEKVLPADKAPSDAPLRPLNGMALYKLSNLRIEGNKLLVHYERVVGEGYGSSPSLVLRMADGNEISTIGGFGPFQQKNKAGDFGVMLTGLRGGPPKNVEVYLVQNDRRWADKGFRPRFKVSNSVVLGDIGRPLQLAREWKADETTKLDNPPSTLPKVNANKTIGQDTPFIGNTAGLLPPQRYADPDKRPVIGVLFRKGEKAMEKKGPKVNVLISLQPVYDPDQPRFNQTAEIAKPGYAMGGLNVKTKSIVKAVQVVYMKQKSDGKLDPADTYTSEWLGFPDEADKTGSLIAKGRKVIGMHTKTFGAVNSVALVLE